MIGRWVRACVLIASLVRVADAQVVETPVAFDSAGSVRTINPGLAERLALTAPAWPVTGTFQEARLYSVSSGGFVLVVHLEGGAIQRFALSASERDALRRAITDAMAMQGRMVTGSDNVSGPARGAFIRNQMLLTALVYAPAAAALTHDARLGTGVYLVLTGGSYFVLSRFAERRLITRAQNHLATDGGLRGALLTNGLLHTFGVDMNADIATGAGLAGALAGAVTGFKVGQRWTDSEAHATTNASTLATLTAYGVAGAAGIFDDSSNERLMSGIAAASGVAGYALGRFYPRRAGYRVTAGDIGMLQLTGVLGVGLAAIPFIDVDNVNEKAVAGSLTAGLLAGVLVGDLVYVRRFDHSEAESWRVKLGALAGGLLGGAAWVLTRPEPQGGFAMLVSGTVAGTVLGQRLVRPERAVAQSSLRPGQVPLVGFNFR